MSPTPVPQNTESEGQDIAQRNEAPPSFNRRRRAFVDLLALGGYLLLSLCMFGVNGSLTQDVLGSGDDPLSFVWLLGWWPWAILHFKNPFVTQFLWHPYGQNLTWVTSVPTLSLLGSPLTMLASAVATFNIATLLAPALSAWTAYLLATRITNKPAIAWISGNLFGFSSYELGHLLGHLNLDTVFIIPLFALLCLKRLDGELSRRRYVAFMTIALLAQLGISTEIFATSCLAGAAAWCSFLPFLPRPARYRMWLMAVDSVGAIGLTATIASPYLVYLLSDIRQFPIDMPETYSADLLNYAVPTIVTRFGRHIFADIARHFAGNAAEQGAYLGVPMILILVLYFRQNVHDTRHRPLLILLGLAIVCSLGPSLWINGINTHLALPWALVQRLPLIGGALPTRFTMYVSLIVSIITALWLGEDVGRGARIGRFMLVVLAGLFLAPNTTLYIWHRLPLLRFFEPEFIASSLGPDQNVLILPFARGLGMLWQWQARYRFSQSGGYIAMPAVVAAWPITGQLWGDPGLTFANDLVMYCYRTNISAILVGPGTPAKLRTAIHLLGWPQHQDGEITVVSVPDIHDVGYYSVSGDYIPGDPANWMGHTVTISTYYRPFELVLDGSRPDGRLTELRAEINGVPQDFQLSPNGVERILLPANATVKVIADPTFVPDQVLHNGDRRDLSVHIVLSPATPR